MWRSTTSTPVISTAISHGLARAALGGDLLLAGQKLALVLHSVVVPQARNLLLNPLHPAMAQVGLVHQAPSSLFNIWHSHPPSPSPLMTRHRLHERFRNGDQGRGFR